MIIQTNRCTVRPFEENDIDAFMAYRNDMDWMKYQGLKGLTRQRYVDILLRNHSIQHGFQLAVICDETSLLIGDVYLKQEDNTCLIGYSISRSNARKGYTYEVVSAIISSLREKNIRQIQAGVDSDNSASIALLKKLKFTYASTDGKEQIYTLQLAQIHS